MVRDFKMKYFEFTRYDTVIFYDPKKRKVQLIKHRGSNAYSSMIYYDDQIYRDPRYLINE